MNFKFVIRFFLILVLIGCHKTEPSKYLFFLHNRFLETHELNELHPEYGRTQYKEILTKFQNVGFNVISEKRKGNVNARTYANLIVKKIDSLMQSGIQAQNITVAGTSKGGYIAQYVSTLANNPNLNFVFVASFRESDITNIPEINYCGNILNIFEKSDPFGVSAIKRKNSSTCDIQNFKEIQLDTGLRHGFLFQPLQEWVQPTIEWANGNYDMK
ncbi:alpha/beta hydrolase [Tenacibaculum sp. 190524A05c]|uniref:alpha/beta hydrolase n=1 Tax=Tenacibaculum platacis TaxID=3137852 RepID=UPI0031FB1DF8